MSKCFDMALVEPHSQYELSGYRCSECDGATVNSIEEHGIETTCPFEDMPPCFVCSWVHATQECSTECDTFFCKEHMPKSEMCEACENKEEQEPDYDAPSPGERAEMAARIQRDFK
jgi:hypothetical protein